MQQSMMTVLKIRGIGKGRKMHCFVQWCLRKEHVKQKKPINFRDQCVCDRNEDCLLVEV